MGLGVVQGVPGAFEAEASAWQRPGGHKIGLVWKEWVRRPRWEIRLRPEGEEIARPCKVGSFYSTYTR